MSTEYAIGCRTCLGSDPSMFEDLSTVLRSNYEWRRRDNIHEIIPALQVIGENPDVFRGLSVRVDVISRICGNDGPNVVAFAIKHAGHDIQVFDEYGSWVDECGKTSRCSPCCRGVECRKQNGHDGPCEGCE